MELPPRTEHYLRAILGLHNERGYARVVDIATRIRVYKHRVYAFLPGTHRAMVFVDDPQALSLRRSS